MKWYSLIWVILMVTFIIYEYLGVFVANSFIITLVHLIAGTILVIITTTGLSVLKSMND